MTSDEEDESSWVDRDVSHPPDPDEMVIDYPEDYDAEERVEHVIRNEWPRWREVRWIAEAADTDVETVQSVVDDRLAQGELEVRGDAVRRNRYHVYFEEVEELMERAEERPRSLW
jgi:hypothetical protein